MEILVDREIPGAASVFADFGHARLFEGRSLAAADLGDAEVLLVRSVTRVDGAGASTVVAAPRPIDASTDGGAWCGDPNDHVMQGASSTWRTPEAPTG